MPGILSLPIGVPRCFAYCLANRFCSRNSVWIAFSESFSASLCGAARRIRRRVDRRRDDDLLLLRERDVLRLLGLQLRAHLALAVDRVQVGDRVAPEHDQPGVHDQHGANEHQGRAESSPERAHPPHLTRRPLRNVNLVARIVPAASVTAAPIGARDGIRPSLIRRTDSPTSRPAARAIRIAGHDQRQRGSRSPARPAPPRVIRSSSTQTCSAGTSRSPAAGSATVASGAPAQPHAARPRARRWRARRDRTGCGAGVGTRRVRGAADARRRAARAAKARRRRRCPCRRTDTPSG